MLGSIGKQSDESVEKKRNVAVGRICRKKVLSLEWKSELWRNTDNNRHKHSASNTCHGYIIYRTYKWNREITETVKLWIVGLCVSLIWTVCVCQSVSLCHSVVFLCRTRRRWRWSWQQRWTAAVGHYCQAHLFSRACLHRVLVRAILVHPAQFSKTMGLLAFSAIMRYKKIHTLTCSHGAIH